MSASAKPFVPLAFPPWLVWGQRSGASIDNEALAALHPDHRRYVRVDGAFKMVGTVRHCGWCAQPCGGRRTAWCSKACADRFYRVWSWGKVAEYVTARDGDRCTRCGTADSGSADQHRATGFDVDHIVCVVDGGTDDPANLRTLCQTCHVAVGYEQRRARRERTQPALALSGVEQEQPAE